jgi:RNA polymerase sigma-70 factor (ECF subfamily)
MNDNQKDFTQLIKHILSGSQQSYSELYEKTIHYVYKNVYFLIDDKNEIDDLIQDIYIQVYKYLSKYDRERQFKPWLMGIAIKQIQSYRRKRWMRLRIVKKAEQYEQTTEVDFSGDIVNKLSNQHLVNLVNELPYKLKQVIILRYLNGHSQEEVATILNIPIGTVKSRIHSALKKLRSNEQGKKLFLEKAGNV